MIWSGYTQFIEVLNKHTKSEHPQEKSFHILQEAVKNALIPAKLKLTEFIASKLNCFLWGFQTDQPMVPFFCDVMKDLLSSVMNMFIHSGSCNDTIAHTKNILQETIQ